MEHLDKITWDKIKLNPDRYEHIPIPTSIYRILRPEVKNRVLICYYVHKDMWDKVLDTEDERTIIMEYVLCTDTHIEKKGGYCCTHRIKEEKLKDRLEVVAKGIAETWPEYAVRHRNKKD